MIDRPLLRTFAFSPRQYLFRILRSTVCSGTGTRGNGSPSLRHTGRRRRTSPSASGGSPEIAPFIHIRERGRGDGCAGRKPAKRLRLSFRQPPIDRQELVELILTHVASYLPRRHVTRATHGRPRRRTSEVTSAKSSTPGRPEARLDWPTAQPVPAWSCLGGATPASGAGGAGEVAGDCAEPSQLKSAVTVSPVIPTAEMRYDPRHVGPPLNTSGWPHSPGQWMVMAPLEN